VQTPAMQLPYRCGASLHKLAETFCFIAGFLSHALQQNKVSCFTVVLTFFISFESHLCDDRSLSEARSIYRRRRLGLWLLYFTRPRPLLYSRQRIRRVCRPAR